MNQNKYIIWVTTQKYYQSIFIRTKSKIEKIMHLPQPLKKMEHYYHYTIIHKYNIAYCNSFSNSCIILYHNTFSNSFSNSYLYTILVDNISCSKNISNINTIHCTRLNNLYLKTPWPIVIYCWPYIYIKLSDNTIPYYIVPFVFPF